MKNKPYVIYTDFGNSLPQGSVAAAIDRVHHDKSTDRPEILYDYKDVEPWSIKDGAFHSSQIAHDWKHRRPVHVAVIDPTVGFSSCERIAVETECAGILVGPNNGIFALTIAEFGAKYAAVIDENLRTIPRHESNTFDGRDLFAPAAAKLATGTPINRIGRELPADKLAQCPVQDKEVIHHDQFGNYKLWCASQSLRNRIGETIEISDKLGNSHQVKIVRHHSEASEGDLILIPGSSGLAEIWVVWGNAREKLGYTVEDVVKIPSLQEEISV